jgi:hypothetical protein
MKEGVLMSMPLRATGLKVGLVVLGVGGLAAGVAAASSGSTPPPVDHQLCYTASGAPFKIPTGVRLKDQFSPNGFVPRINPSLVLHCNPVAKTVPTHVVPITNPAAHLACFPITPPSPQPTPTVVLTNQFGSATLRPSQPNLLCLPSWKGLTGPPNKTPNTPPGLNHFTCYPVRVASGAYRPPPVMLQDEFTQKPVPAQVSPVPAELCLPTAKIVGTRIYNIINPAQHLLCFPVTPTPIIPTVWDENQFGTSKLTVSRTKWLCVPSTKKIG